MGRFLSEGVQIFCQKNAVGVSRWIRPEKLIKTHSDPRHNAMLDFASFEGLCKRVERVVEDPSSVRAMLSGWRNQKR